MSHKCWEGVCKHLDGEHLQGFVEEMPQPCLMKDSSCSTNIFVFCIVVTLKPVHTILHR